jgi:pre-mRNA-splicing factor 18
MERKKRALAQAKVGAVVLPVAAAAGGAAVRAAEPARASSTKYLNAGQLRRRLEEEEERLKHGTTAGSSSSKRPRTTNPPHEPVQHDASQSNVPASKKNKPPPAGGDVDASAPASASTETINKSKKRDGDAMANTAGATAADATTQPPAKVLGLDSAAITSQLRGLGLAVRMFGEVGDEKRLERLQRAAARQQSTLKSLSEKQEFRLGAGHAIRNPFLDQDKRSTSLPSDSNRAGSKAGTSKREDAKDDDDDEEGDDQNDPHKRIYSYLKSLLQQWEHDLSLRPEAVRSSVAGRKDTNTLQQCKDYIAPLFKLLKRRQLEASLTANLTKIVAYCQEGEFVRANDAYMDIAIGRAAWPIGVTQVGIHSRTGRSKIESSNVAHVMNSELQRKYLTSVKRLITYAQAKSSADPSKKVLN